MADLLQIGNVTDVMRKRLEAAFTIHKLADGNYPAEAITHVATNGHDGVPAEVMAGLPNLQMISCYGVGYDAIDVDAAKARSIMVTHTPNVLNAEVATTALMLMIACYREILRDDAWVRSGDWETKGNAPLTRSVDNQTVGILGLGRIGQAIAPIFAPIGIDWRGGVSLLAGFVAKEIVVSTMGVLYAVDTASEPEALNKALLESGITPLAAFAMMVFVLLYLPCLATVAAIRRETRSPGWMIFSIAYTTSVAWLMSFVVYQSGQLLGLS